MFRLTRQLTKSKRIIGQTKRYSSRSSKTGSGPSPAPTPAPTPALVPVVSVDLSIIFTGPKDKYYRKNAPWLEMYFDEIEKETDQTLIFPKSNK